VRQRTVSPSEPAPEADGAQGLGALAGLRVVELGVWVAAPAAAALLADWGADVIKVEPPTGDPEVVQDRQLAANEGFVEVDGGALRLVNGPITFSDVPAPQDARVPALGEHTDEVLAELAEPASDTAGAGSAT
jgi:crotonobetainyl-CoA:carnitine CoA-transferase CaiB-like acyl-CoA transferase